MNNQRQIILDNIKKALQTPSQVSEIYLQPQERLESEIKAVRPRNIEGLWELFQNNLQEVSGEFHFVKNTDKAAEWIGDFLKKSNCTKISISNEDICTQITKQIVAKNNKLTVVKAADVPSSQRKQKLAEINFSLVSGSFAVADTGSLAVFYEKSHTSYPHFLAGTVIAVVNYADIAADLFGFFEKIEPRMAENMVFITGPSRTADIEKILILGAHGPRQLVVIAVAEN